MKRGKLFGILGAAIVVMVIGSGLALATAGDESAAGIAVIPAGSRSVTVDPGIDLGATTKAFAELRQWAGEGVTVERVKVKAQDNQLQILLSAPAAKKTKVSWGVLNGDSLAGPEGPTGPEGPAGPQGDPASASTPLCPGCPLGGAKLAGANLAGAYLADAVLTGANLSGADLTGAVFVGAYADGVDFSNANLSGADITGPTTGQTVLVRGDFRGANLSGADASGDTVFSYGDFTGADLTNANLGLTAFGFADFTDADFTGAIGMDTAGIGTVTWANTTCPDGTNSNDNVATCVGHLVP